MFRADKVAAGDAELIGNSPPIRTLMDRLGRAAGIQRTTLITGPTGSGKELVARALWSRSTRRSLPMITVHCGALPDTLVESELFGHHSGSFTGASHGRQGLVRAASGGTLFLDEVNSLSASAQAKLLRFLDCGEFRAVGSDRIERSDVWIIAATNEDLHGRVRDGTFRPDLLYRLDVVRLAVPALRERGDDILLLADHFARRLTGHPLAVEPATRDSLLAYDWPGNVRELKHRIEAALLFGDASGLACEVLRPPAGSRPREIASPSGLDDTLWRLIEERGLSLAQAIDLCEQSLLRRALASERDNRTRAAARLGIHVRTLFKKLAGDVA